MLARDSGYSMDDEAEETTKYNDIVMGDFNESYANLALKHLMGLLWIRNECSSSSTKYKNSHFPFKISSNIALFLSMFQASH